ncbi:MAG: PKD domain-containing protein, partial [Thermoplasmata archaeon]
KNSTTGKFEISIAMLSSNIVRIEVLIPSSATGQDVLTITVSSKTNPARTNSASITTLINQGPIPQITSHSDGAIINAGSVSLFNSTATDPENDAIVSYLWNFGDGTTCQGQNAEHNYSIGGRYTISLTATDALGRTSTIHLNIIVNNLPTIAVLSPKTPSPTVIEEHSITFKISTFDQEGEELTHIWTVDGKNAGNGKSLKYTPQMKDADKIHLIKLTVSDTYSQVSQEWNVKVVKDSSLLASRNIWIIWLLIAISFCIIGGVIAYNNRSRFFTIDKKKESVIHTQLTPLENAKYEERYQDYNKQIYAQTQQNLNQQTQNETAPYLQTGYSQQMQPAIPSVQTTSELQSASTSSVPTPTEPKAKRGTIKIVKEHVEGALVSENISLPLTAQENETLPDLPDIDELIQLKTAESVSTRESNAQGTEPKNVEAKEKPGENVEPNIEPQQPIQVPVTENVTLPTTLPKEKVEPTPPQEYEVKAEPQIEKQEYEIPHIEEKQPSLEVDKQPIKQPTAQTQVQNIHTIVTPSLTSTVPIISEKESKTEQVKEEYSLPVQLIKMESKPKDTKSGLLTTDTTSERFQAENQAETETQILPQKESKKSKPKIVAEVAPTTAVAIQDSDLPKAKSKPKIVGETKPTQEVKKPKIVAETTQTQAKPPAQKKIEIKPIKDEKQAIDEKEILKEETKEINKSLQSLLEECNTMLSTISTYQTAKDEKKNEKKL